MAAWDYYIISRQPKALEAKIRPFDSLNGKIWGAISFSYTTYILSCTIIFLMLKHHLPEYENSKSAFRMSLETLIYPGSLYWQRILKSGLLFQLLITFVAWMINVLYGLNLRAALIKQNFEFEVNEWEHLELFRGHILMIQSDDSSYNIPKPDWLFSFIVRFSELGGLEWRSMPLVTYHYDISVLYYHEAMQTASSPNDLVAIATKYAHNSAICICSITLRL